MNLARSVAMVSSALILALGTLIPTVTARDYFWASSGLHYEQSGGESVDYIKTAIHDGDWFSCGALTCSIIMSPITVTARAYGSSVMAGLATKYTSTSPYCSFANNASGRYIITFTAGSGYVSKPFYSGVCTHPLTAIYWGPDIIGAVCADLDWCSTTLYGYLQRGPYQWIRTPVPGNYSAWQVAY